MMLLQVLEVSERLEGVLKSLIEHSAELGFAIIKAVIVFVVGRMIINLLNKLVKNILIKRNFDPSVKSFVSSLVNVTLTILLIISIVGALGVQTTSFAALLASAGVAVGMALSGTVQNFAGGIMLLVFKPFKAGDFIEAQGFSGTVTDVSIVSTKLTTTDNRIIVIPNGSLSNGTINNYSQNVYRRVEWLIDVEYGASSEKMKAILKGILDDEKRIVYAPTAPANPTIALNALRDSSIQFVMRAWVKSGDYWDVLYDVNEKIYVKVPENGIQFPYPQLDVHINKD